MHEICRDIGLSHNRVEHIPNLQQEVAMRQARVVTGKHGMSDLIIALNEEEIRA